MVKVIALGVLLLGSPLWATGKPQVGPQGPQGVMGYRGAQGPPGESEDHHSVDVGLGLGVQYKDTRDWNVGGNYNYFIRNDEHRLVPVVLTYKLGKDHQDDEIKALNAKLEALQASVATTTKQSSQEKVIINGIR